MTTRRGFLQAILAAGVAPYVSTAAGVLMPVKKIAEAPLGEFFIKEGDVFVHRKLYAGPLTPEELREYATECLNFHMRNVVMQRREAFL